jgi:hypothetical protein
MARAPAAKMMVSSVRQLAPKDSGAVSQMVSGAPPVTGTFWSLLFLKNPTH